MKNYLRTGYNWLNRLINYGFGNTLQLKKHLKKDGFFPLKIKGHDFYIRGNTVDFSVLNGIFVKREYDIDPGFTPEIIIDAGANIGASTFFLRLKYPEARIFAIEPERSNFELLVRNISGLKNIVPENAAVWARHSSLRIANPDAEKYAYQMGEADSQDGIKGMTIEEFMEQWGLGHIDILKLDIEGAEKDLFDQKEVSWLKRVRVLIIELHDSLLPGTSEIFYKALSEIEYTMMMSGENCIIFNKSFTPEK